jgi:hypothetical protein
MRDLRELNINEGGKPVARAAPTDQQIHEFEARFDVRLPESYKSLLKFSNGGHPELDAFQPNGAAEAAFWGINRFYHLDNGRTDHEGIWRSTEEWRSSTGQRIVPVANDGGGNQLVLNYDLSPPSVHMLIHDEDFRLLQVANTFDEFLNLLSRDPDMI